MPRRSVLFAALCIILLPRCGAVSVEGECEPGLVLCGDAGCVELGSVEHCAECFDDCAKANAAPICREDGCDFVCNEGFANCDGDAETGCERELDEWGTCGMDCGDSTYCGPAGCVDLGSMEHCTACFEVCEAPANAEAFCDGVCSFECLEGFAICDGDLATGCETALNEWGLCPLECTDDLSDCGPAGCVALGSIEHCAGCFDDCARDNAEVACGALGCEFDCHAGFASCDGDAHTGCEQALNVAEHCGACGAACPAPPANMVAICADRQTGECVFVCEEGFASCDGDAETGCEHNLALGSCCDEHSRMVLSDGCLVAGSSDRTLVRVELRDLLENPVTGGVLEVEAPGFESLSEIVESTTQPGVYLMELSAPEGVGEHVINVSLSNGDELACGANMTFTHEAVTVVEPSPHALGGTGGCPARSGNLRVRVSDEGGEPIGGAFVMVGQSARDDAFHLDYEAFLAGEVPRGPNHALTDEHGYVVFRDVSGALQDPALIITAGADQRAYGSVVGFGASDVSLRLDPLPPPPQRVTLRGSVTPGYTSGSNVVMSLVTPGLDIATLARFEFTHLLEDGKILSHSGASCDDGTSEIPSNVHFPRQSFFFGSCTLEASPSNWVLTPERGPAIDVPALQGQISLTAALGLLDGDSPDMAALISALTFQRVGVKRGVSTQSDQQNLDIARESTLGETMDVRVQNAPQGDIFVLSVGDMEGGDGSGSLFLQDIKMAADATSYTRNMRTAQASGQFSGATHLAMALVNVAGGMSGIIDRETLDRNSRRTLDSFFEAPSSAFRTGRSFSWPEVANEHSPADYHVARLILRRSTASGDYRDDEEPFWVIYAPSGVRSLTLPTLPPSAPRAASGGFLTASGGSVNKWFLGLYYLGLLEDPDAFEPNRLGFGEIEERLTHLSVTDRRL